MENRVIFLNKEESASCSYLEVEVLLPLEILVLSCFVVLVSSFSALRSLQRCQCPGD